jgi:hypothetical protein
LAGPSAIVLGTDQYDRGLTVSAFNEHVSNVLAWTGLLLAFALVTAVTIGF